jgi:hypothetical protein
VQSADFFAIKFLGNKVTTKGVSDSKTTPHKEKRFGKCCTQVTWFVSPFQFQSLLKNSHGWPEGIFSLGLRAKKSLACIITRLDSPVTSL